MEAAVVERNIDVEDVSIFQRSVVGNTMTDDLVGTCADRFWKVAVVERGWVGL